MSWRDMGIFADPYRHEDAENLWRWFTPRKVAIVTLIAGFVGGVIRGWT